MVSTQLALSLTIVTLATFSLLGVWYARGRIETVEDYIVARDTADSGMTTATLVASVMGVWILLSPAEAGAAFGGVSAVVGYAVGEMLPMLAYARLGPRIRELIPNGHTLTEYALARYGRAMYTFVLLVSVFYMFIFLAAELTGITTALNFVAGVPRWQTALLVGGFVLAYTTYGGLRASIFTDTVQTVLILPLLVLSAVGAVFALGGVGTIQTQVVTANPSLLDPTFFTGLRFGVWVAVAILGAELINQSWWQRIYAAQDTKILRKSFRTAAVTNFCIVFLAGLFGVVARGYTDIVVDASDPGYNASVAFFVLLRDAFPEWIVLVVVFLAVLLVMSSADTLFNALASVVTADFPRLVDDLDDRTLTLCARGLTVVVAVAAIYVSLRARSVLRLFLLADLLGAAVMVPLLSGLYSARVSGLGALAASVAGLIVGVAYFPTPLVRSTLTLLPIIGDALPTPDFFVAFLGAAGISTVITFVSAIATASRFDFTRLAWQIRRLDDQPADVEADD